MDPIMSPEVYYNVIKEENRVSTRFFVKSFDEQYLLYVQTRIAQAEIERIISPEEYDNLIKMTRSEDLENLHVAIEIVNQKIKNYGSDNGRL